MQKYLFLDRGLLNGFRMSNAKACLNKITKENKVLFREDFFSEPPRRWEVRYDNGYPNVIYDEREDIYRCYYTLFTYDSISENTPLSERPHTPYLPLPDRITSLCYAQSKDGVNWEKPELGLVEFEGSTKNNILFRYAHGTSVFLDKEETDPKKRYKLITKVEYSANNNFMAVGFSEDGIHFDKLIPWPKYNPRADTHNFAFRDHKTKKFILITRVWGDGARIVAKCESDDFINWSEPVEIARGQGFENQIYAMPIFQYNGLYIGLSSIFHEGDMSDPNYDTVDLRLQCSTDLKGWYEPAYGDCFIERGEGSYPNGAFDCGCIYASAPVEIDNKLYFYYMGGNGQHTNYRETSFARGYVKKDQFLFYTQKNSDKEAILQTRSMNVYGSRLEVLADIEAGGFICVKIMDARGRVEKEGFTAIVEDCNTFHHTVTFKEHSFSELIGGEYSIQLTWRAARIYGLCGEMSFIKRI